MKNCEDCGDAVSRRTRCKLCKIFVCRWCYHHLHFGRLATGVAARIRRNRKATR